MSEQRDFVDFNNGGDTGQNNLDSIQPLTNGEGATQVVLRRPAENIRSRTEILRDEIEELKYYRDYGQLMIESNGNITWGGASDDAGTGFITSSATLRITPLLAPLASTKGTLTLGVTNQVIYTISATGFATQGMNAILVEHRDVTGTTLSASITKGPVKRIVVLFDSANGAHTPAATAAVVAAAVSSDSASDTVYGITGKVTVTTSGTGIIEEYSGRIEGTADAELHVVTASNLGAISLAKGDGIAIWYRHLVEPSGIAGDTTDPKGGSVLGGRAESTVGRPDASTSIPAGSLFKTSASASKIPGAIPICRVANNGQLIFFDGTRVQKGETVSFASATSVASAALAAHIANLATINGAGLVGYNGSGNWADGVQAIASGVTLEAAVDEVVSDLAATTAPSGALHIGVDAGTIFSGALTATGGGGGQSADTTLRAALDRLDSSVVARRAYTAVVTDGSASTGGDINTADVVPAINTLAATGGTYLLRRGAYNLSTNFTTAKNTHLIGEDVAKVMCAITNSGAITLFGSTLNDQFSFENIFLKGHASNNYQYQFAGGAYALRNCRATAGALHFGPSASTRIDINGLIIDDDTLAYTAFSSIEFYNSSPGTDAVTGLIKGLRVSVVPSGSNTSIEKYGIWVNNVGTKAASRNYEPLVFEDAIIDISAGFGNVGASDGAVAYFNASHQPQVYRNCVFRCSQSNASITPIVMSIVNSTNIAFDNCKFIQDGYGKVLSVTGSSNNIRFKACKFYTSTSAVNYPEIGIVCDEALSTDPGQDIVIEDCYAEIRYGTSTGGTTTRRIEIGTEAGVATGDGSYTIDGLHINLNYSNVTTLADYTVSISTGAGPQSVVEARNITFDLQGKRLAGASTRALFLNSYPTAGLEVDGLYLKNVTEPDTTTGATTLTCALVEVSRGRVNGGSVNGTAAGSNVSAWSGLFKLTGSGASVEGIRFWESTSPNRGRLINMDSDRGKVLGNVCLVSNFATGEDTPGWFCYVNQGGSMVEGNTVSVAGTRESYLAATDDHALIFLADAGDSGTVLGNTLRAPQDVKCITVDGDRNSVLGNTCLQNLASTDVDAIRFTTNASANTATANTVSNTGAGGSSLITDNNTSTSAPNRIFGNTTDVTVTETQRILGVCDGQPITGWNLSAINAGATSANGIFAFSLNDYIPDGAIITGMFATVDPNTTASYATAGNRMQIALYGADKSNNLIDNIGPVTDTNTTTSHDMSIGTISVTVDKANKVLTAIVYASVATTTDLLYSLTVSYTTPKFYVD